MRRKPCRSAGAPRGLRAARPKTPANKDGSTLMPGFLDRLRAFWNESTAAPQAPAAAGAAVRRGGPREAGPPRSPNGASSFHLQWQLPRTAEASRLVEVSAVLEVQAPPRVRSLYFWALQVDFEEDGLVWGGAHTGLQWNRSFPGGTAVNWGGYASQERGGAVLAGSFPSLPTLPGDPNTMSYPWQPQRPYRLCVSRSPETAGAWRSTLTDLTSGEATVLRDLMHPDSSRGRSGAGPGGREAAYLRRPVVWSEVFADCDAPSVVVRWSDLTGVSEDGTIVTPEAVVVNYQSYEAGGCANTSVRFDGSGFLQVTNTPRDVAQGAALQVGGGPLRT